ncbi:DUF421 domain-containing protein [Paenibacillus tarimensis]
MPEYILIFIRALFSFLVLLLMTRLMGKVQLSQLTFFDYVVGISIGSIAASLSIDQNIELLNGVIGILIWGLLPILISVINLKSYRFRQLTEGQPTVIIENGNILERNMKKERINVDELMLLLREKNAFKLSEVEFAVFETNGKLSVMKKTTPSALPPNPLNVTAEQEHDPRLVIMDGSVMEQTLRDMGYTKEWLLGEVKKQGANDYSDVFFAQLTSDGALYVDLYRDQSRQIPVSQMLLVQATIEKVQADLRTFSLETDNPAARKMYEEQAQRLATLSELLQPYLKG